MIAGVIVDCHTHVFPPSVIRERQRYTGRDATFSALYADPRAALATADDLLGSMEESGVDVSVALGFAWHEEATCRLHNDYLIEAASRSGGRLVAFCTLPLACGEAAIEAEMRRCSAAGALGFGELRPQDAGFDLEGDAGRLLARTARELGRALLFHVSEPVGHLYPGKEGLDVGAFYRFVAANPEAAVIGAHWGGGLPFYASMPEVRQTFAGSVYIDTAATSLLYDPGVYERGAGLIGSDRVLFGSDYPLLSQKRSLRRIRESGLDQASQALVSGGNASRLLGLPS